MIIPSSIERRTDGRWRVTWPLSIDSQEIAVSESTITSNTKCAFSKNGAYFAYCDDSNIYVYDTSDFSLVNSWSAGYSILGIDFAFWSTQKIITFGRDASNDYFTFWEVDGDKLNERTLTLNTVRNIATALEYPNVLYTTATSAVVINANTYATINTVALSEPPVNALLSNTGSWIFSSTNSEIKKYRVSDGTLLSTNTNANIPVFVTGYYLIAFDTSSFVYKVFSSFNDELITKFNIGLHIKSVSPNSKYLIATDYASVFIYNTIGWKLNKKITSTNLVSIHQIGISNTYAAAINSTTNIISFEPVDGITDTAQIWQDGRVVAEVDAPTNYYDFLYTETAPEIEIIEKVSTPENYCVSCVASPTIETQWRGTPSADLYELKANINGAGYATLAEYPEDGRGYYLHDFEAEDEDTISMKVQAVAGQTDAAAPEFSFVVTAPPTRPEVVVSYDSEAGAIIFEEAE